MEQMQNRISQEITSVVDKVQPKYVLTQHEPLKLDTGEDYIKIPLGAFLRIEDIQEDKAMVARITCSFNCSSGHGRVAFQSLQPVDPNLMPPYVLLADKVQDYEVKINFGDEEENITKNHPHFDAGPKCVSVRNGRKFKV